MSMKELKANISLMNKFKAGKVKKGDVVSYFYNSKSYSTKAEFLCVKNEVFGTSVCEVFYVNDTMVVAVELQ